jgi:ubiquinone/menaquinone biosynthesis C-methylase UbiE
MLKLDIGSGRKTDAGFVTLDKTPFIDGRGRQVVDVLCDIEKEKLPYEDNSVDEIRVDSLLEHLHELCFALNEMHRVLKVEGRLIGSVPRAGTLPDYKDPTHVRHFIKETFFYFIGSNPAKPERPAKPEYADYGYMPWIANDIHEENNLIFFDLSPRK